MEFLPLNWAAVAIQVLGIPGLIFIIWHFDNKRFQKEAALRATEIAEREKAIDAVLSQYKEDVSGIRKLYENNVSLVKDYAETCTRLEKLFDQTIGVVSLNTQVFTRLNDSIEHNLFCPMVRKEISARG